MHCHPQTKLRLALIPLAAAVVMAAGCSGGKSDDNAPPPVVAVQVATVAQGPMERWVRASAVLYPLHQAIITPKISAPVSRFYVNRGDHVHAGEELAQLESKDLTAAAQESAAQLETAQANYQTAMAGSIPADLQKAQLDVDAAKKALDNQQKIYDSRQQLFSQGAIPRRDLDQAGVDLTNAKNAYTEAEQHLQAMQAVGHTEALKAAQGDLDTAKAHAAGAAAQAGYATITSPIDGVVTDRPVYPGELATTSAPLMTVMDLSQIVARIPLPAEQAALLKVGDAATITAPGLDKPIPAKVTVVSAATDPNSTTIQVWVQAKNPNEQLRPGTSVQVAMLAQTLPRAVTIPASALLTDSSGDTSVMMVTPDSVAHQQNVEVGVKEPDTVQITKGLQPGQKVVSVGAYGLPDKTKIKVEAPAPADADKGQ